MKRFVTILLMVIVGLATFMPCCTEDNCAQEQAMAASSQSDDKSQDGACSPFSSCMTCSGFTAQVEYVQVTPPPVNLQQHHDQEDTQLLPSPSFSFWQPPKPAID